MKNILSILIISFLLLLSGCVSESTDDMRHKYRLLYLGASADEILQLIGTPDVKIPKLIGERWVWKDGAGGDRIVAYLSPQKRWNIPKTEITPSLKINTGRLIFKQWIQAGAS